MVIPVAFRTGNSDLAMGSGGHLGIMGACCPEVIGSYLCFMDETGPFVKQDNVADHSYADFYGDYFAAGGDNEANTKGPNVPQI